MGVKLERCRRQNGSSLSSVNSRPRRRADPYGSTKSKFDGYRMSARIENGAIQLLTRAGLDWTAEYLATAAALAKLKVKSAYLDGELCGVRPDRETLFELMQQASERGAKAKI
jgi:ATP-dependent DNA ligase